MDGNCGACDMSINPFWWPVKASLANGWRIRLLELTRIAITHDLFPSFGREVDAAYEKYLTAMANGVARYKQSRSVFPFDRHGNARPMHASVWRRNSAALPFSIGPI